ncbi:hypothetical protein [Demequina silvatica]|uniref:hypothetical protein n=1 Tax=Demequina silvatica TaxID=1638988 RepID=UPI0007829A6C|nr:hypothetical protein [Demequina silvatica]
MQIYRARTSTMWGWSAIGIGVLVAVLHVASVGFAYAHGGLGLGAAIALFGYAAFLRPHVAAAEDRVEVHNVTQTVVVPFERLESLDTRWTFEAVGDDGSKVGAFAAPAPGAATTRRHERDEKAQLAAGAAAPIEPTRPGDRLGTPSGDAAAMVQRAWDEWRAAQPAPATATGDAPVAAGPAVQRRPDWIGIALMTAGTAAALWGLFS